MEESSRLCLIFVGTLLWTFIHRIVNDKLALRFVPSEVRESVLKRKAKDKEFRCLSEANGTAFIHACVVSPICLALGYQLLNEDPWEGESAFFDLTAIVMLGYFCWDVCICLTCLSNYGLAFLLHGVLSLVGLYVQVSSNRCRMLGFAAMFAASEISTPFLHWRWFCLKAKYTDKPYFHVVNWCFLISYLCMRLIYLPLFVFPVFWLDCLELKNLHNMSFARRALQCGTTLVWTALNYYWGYLLFATQYKQITAKKKHESSSSTKSSSSSSSSNSSSNSSSSSTTTTTYRPRQEPHHLKHRTRKEIDSTTLSVTTTTTSSSSTTTTTGSSHSPTTTTTTTTLGCSDDNNNNDNSKSRLIKQDQTVSSSSSPSSSGGEESEVSRDVDAFADPIEFMRKLSSSILS